MLVKSLGADKIINYKTERFGDTLRDYDVLYDTLGDDSLEKAVRVVNAGEHVVSITGVPSARFGRLHKLDVLKPCYCLCLVRKLVDWEKCMMSHIPFGF